MNANRYLQSLNIDTMRPGLAAIKGCLTALDHPQNAFDSVIIGGTNGKGSTAAMTASILAFAGLRVGLYTSPHLVDVRERITINGKKIPVAAFDRTLSVIQANLKKPLTYFETLTVAAFLHFRDERVDIAIMEVGMGGRLDATNVCRPKVSVITNVSLEHTAWLGKTLAAIAYEKAGIIHRGSRVVTAVSQPAARAVLEETCLRQKVALDRYGRDFSATKHADGSLSYEGDGLAIHGLFAPLAGKHQVMNTALALRTVELLARRGVPVDERAIRQGLQNTRWPARMETLGRRPRFVLDAAHNPAGIRAFGRALTTDFTYRRLILIFAALSDKSYRAMLSILGPLADVILLPAIESPRAIAPAVLQGILRPFHPDARVAAGVADAVQMALTLAGPDDMIAAVGSIYLAGEIKQAFPHGLSYDKGHRDLKKRERTKAEFL